MPPWLRPGVETILEQAEARGLSAGIDTARLTHAAPAVNYAHVGIVTGKTIPSCLPALPSKISRLN